MIKTLYCTLLAILTTLGVLQANPTHIYVATTGSDKAVGTSKAPVASLQAALQRAKEVQGDCHIVLKPGTYCLSSTVVIDPSVQQSGRQLTITSQDTAHPAVLCSDYRPKKWKKVTLPNALFPHLPQEANLWVADIADLPMEKRFFKVMYDADQMLPRARSAGFQPNTEKLPRFKCWEDMTTLHFPKGTLKNWANLQDVEVFVRPNQRYVVNYLPLASVDEATGIARTAITATYFMGPCLDHENSTISAWYENVPEALDEPGEWIVQSKEAKIYYLPQGNKPNPTVVLPLLREYIQVSGTLSDALDGDIPIQNVHLSNLVLTRADRDVWQANDKGLQHDWDLWDKDNALIRLRGVAHCSVTHCRLYNSAGAGIRVDRYAQHNTLRGNTIDHIGGTGILLAGYGPGLKDVNRENTVSNNDISYCGMLYWHASAIFVWESGSNRIANNKVGNLPYNGIVVAGVRPRFFSVWTDATAGMTGDIVPKDLRENMRLIRWNETGKPSTFDGVMAFNLATHNVIENNEIFNCVELLKDGNPIYFSATGGGNIIRANLIYNCKQAQQDIRFDDDQMDVLATGNIIYGNGIRAKHDNYVENNYFFGGTVVIGNNTGSKTRVNRNIIVLPAKGRIYNGFYGGNEKDEKRHFKILASFEHNYNLFYSVNPEAMRPQFDKLQEHHMETNSVFADPMFANAAGFDLTLLPTSPAWALGIVPINFLAIGLEHDPAFVRLQQQGMPEYKRIPKFMYLIK